MTRIAIFISLIAIVLTFGIIDVQPVAAVSNTGLVGYWSFNEGKGTTATDFSGNGNKGSLVNGPTWVKGRYGKALKFDGVDDYVQVPDSASLSPTSALSVFAWVKPEAVNDYKAIVAKRLSAANDWSYGMRITNTGNGEVEARIHDGTTATSVISSSTLSTGVWYHIGLVYNGSTLKVYINAIERGSGVATVSIQDSDQPLRIGNWTTLTPQDIQHFQGLIDDVRIYNRALSASEIQALYKAGAVKHNNPSNTGLVGYWSFNEGKGTTATDFSGNGNKGSLVNGPTWVKGRYGKALKFDGVDDYVNMGNSLSYSPAVITIGVWIKPASTQSTNGRIVNIQDAANKNYDISILSSTYKIQVINWNGSSASVDITSTNAVQANQWSHIVAIIGNSDNRLYINGKLEASSTSASSQPSSSTLSIGRHLTNGWYFNGLIDDVRIYNRALSASEIQALYKAGAVKHNN
ncbi:MAG: LamG domain-containing protein, partial [Candidatus Bathyarchaeia archaeon]